MPRKSEKTGVWIVGAAGNVGSTVALGIAALKRHLTTNTGLVTELPPFSGQRLVRPSTLVLGGHEVHSGRVIDTIKHLHQRSGVFDSETIKSCGPQIRSFQDNIQPGTLLGASATTRRLGDPSFLLTDRSPAAAIERLSADMVAFRRRHGLDRVIVVNLASSEPPLRAAAAHKTFGRLQTALARPGSRVLPASSLYALAAIKADCAYLNFTPSVGCDLPAIRARAIERGLPYMGNDGKTGETLVKSVLAPMFAMRNLRVLSWIGQNLLGNQDGAALSDPATRASKIRTKNHVTRSLLGDQPATHVGIEHVASLDDWKVAWDFIHFEGFLGTKMHLQFIWHGCDSVLAAPLVLDLVRLTDWTWRRGHVGPMKHLAFFFKAPIDVKNADLSTQWRMLLKHQGAEPSDSR